MHLIVARYSTSFTAGSDLVQGGHENIEKEIAQRKYPMTLNREGYCIPDSGEWRIYEYRVKQEVIADFARDLNAINLNPVGNKVSLWKIFRAKRHTKNCEVKARVPMKQILFLQWCFKWANRLGLSPLAPCPVSDKVPEPFALNFPKSTLILGCRYDPTEKTGYGGNHEDTL